MARRNFVLETLEKDGEVSYSPHGNSMSPRIMSGDKVRVKKVDVRALRVGDAVYAKVKGNYYLHLLTAIDTSPGASYNWRFQISNNHGHVNGWCSAQNVFGLCVQVKEKTIVSDDELAKRLTERE